MIFFLYLPIPTEAIQIEFDATKVKNHPDEIISSATLIPSAAELTMPPA